MKNATISEYLEQLGSSSPAPGGGSSAAVSGAMGAALVSMVANLTTGREKYSEFQDLISDVISRSQKLILELTDCIRKDMNAYDGVMAALRMPKVSDEEKSKRSQALQDAYKVAISAPVETAEKSLEVMRLAEKLLFKSNVNAACDLSAAAIEARAGILIALENVNVNLPGVKDAEYVGKMRAWVSEIDAASEKLLREIREGVAKMSGGK
ncbi:MAG: cyclodeaminase/cyclohydrolase family protein [Synergistaceae bacterium]|nr:cyclodeaminase/cyclohydrolase family protein [Synergistaceae bacterium]